MKCTLFKFTALFAIVAIVLAACSSVKNSTRVSTTLRAQEYNSVASRYMEKPTSVSLVDFSSGKGGLMVEMQTYAVPSRYRGAGLSPESAEVLKVSRVAFFKENIDGYVGAIDKFLDWAALAAERKDAFTKEIGKVPDKGKETLKFEFHSGSDQSHYLVITAYTLGIPDDERAQFYDVAGAKELKRLLLALASGSIQKTDIESVYK